MSEYNQYNPVIIIGMHRSGTSLLCRIIEKMGVFMGLDKEFNNESLFFLKFNDWILQQANATWDNIYNFKFIDNRFLDMMESLARIHLKSLEAKNYMGIDNYLKYKSFFKLDFPWGWKDPRNTFTLDIWLRIFPKAKILHIYRHPLDVALSLKTRSERAMCKELTQNYKYRALLGGCYNTGFRYTVSMRVLDINESVKLYIDYVTKALKYSEYKDIKDQIINIKYEDFVDTTPNILTKIAKFLDIDCDDKTILYLADYINNNRKFSFLENEELVELNQKLLSNNNTYNNLLSKLGYITG